jgi:hypothetical protein
MTAVMRNHLALCAMVLALTALCATSAAHDAYHDWKTRHGMSCCDDKDCAPTTAWQDMDGNWFVRSGGETHPVDPLAILPIPSPDGRSHACILGGRVICFVPGEVRG